MNEDNGLLHNLHSRREFIRSTSLLLTGTTAYTMIPNFAWAKDDAQLEGLAHVCHALYPHEHVPLNYYFACAQGLLDKAAGDANLKSVLDEGMAALDAIYSMPFAELSDDDQALALQRLSGTPFFQTVRGHTVVGLYNIPGIWKYFGYQGPSFAKGGYINRGLNDIFWLKDI